MSTAKTKLGPVSARSRNGIMANELDYLHDWRYRVGMKAISIKVKRIQLTKKNPRLHQRCHQSEMAVEKRDIDASEANLAKHPYCSKPGLHNPNTKL